MVLSSLSKQNAEDSCTSFSKRNDNSCSVKIESNYLCKILYEILPKKIVTSVLNRVLGR